MRVAALFSGGKDSNYAVFWAQHQGWEVDHLVTVYSENMESYMYQVPGVEITEWSSKAIGISHIKVRTSGIKERELEPLENTLGALEIDGIVSGALRSEYQRRRIDQICENLGIKSFAPMWHKNPDKILREMIEEGWEVVVAAVSAYGLDESYIGRRLDLGLMDELMTLRASYEINIDGEGGEFETIVLYGPTYKKRVVITDHKVIWEGSSGYMRILGAELTSA